MSTAKAKRHCIDVSWSSDPVNDSFQVMSSSRIFPHGHRLKANNRKRKNENGIGNGNHDLVMPDMSSHLYNMGLFP